MYTLTALYYSKISKFLSISLQIQASIYIKHTSYILTNFELHEAISARDIEPGPWTFLKTSKNTILEKKCIFFPIWSRSLPLLHPARIWPQSEHQLWNARCPKFSTKPEIVRKRYHRITLFFREVFENSQRHFGEFLAKVTVGKLFYSVSKF